MTARVKDREVEVARRLKGAQSTGGGGFVSGGAISRDLGISRAAVWKHVEGLRKKGYEIESRRAKGYRIREGYIQHFNGVEVASALETELIGRPLYFYSDIDSTNRRAMELASRGVPEGTAIIADSQSKGRGRLGREWHSPPGENLYTSIILRPKIPPAEAPSMTLLFAVAVAEAIGAFVKKGVELKWPNDILIGPGKAAGILTEMAADMDRVEHIVCGVGVNLNMDAPGSEGAVGARVASVKDSCGADIDRTLFAAVLYSAFEKWYKVFLKDGIGPVANAWRGYFSAEGKRIRVDAVGREVSGICTGIDEAGSLLVRLPSGEIEAVSAGDMSIYA